MFGVMTIVFPTVMRDEALLSWKWLNICPLMATSELILCFASLADTVFAFPTKLSLAELT